MEIDANKSDINFAKAQYIYYYNCFKKRHKNIFFFGRKFEGVTGIYLQSLNVINVFSFSNNNKNNNN